MSDCDYSNSRLGKYGFHNFCPCSPTSRWVRRGTGTQKYPKWKKPGRSSKSTLAIHGMTDVADRWHPYWRKIQMTRTRRPMCFREGFTREWVWNQVRDCIISNLISVVYTFLKKLLFCYQRIVDCHLKPLCQGKGERGRHWENLPPWVENLKLLGAVTIDSARGICFTAFLYEANTALSLLDTLNHLINHSIPLQH